MNENDKHFIKRYEELLDKGYCDCNEMNCIDNNSPRRILNIVNNLQSKIDKAIEFVESMEYCGQEDYFYDNKSKDPCGNDNTFNDSKNKLLDILKGSDKECQN